MATISITSTSTTEFDGEFEVIITDRLDGTFSVEVAHHAVWFGTAVASSYALAQRAAGVLMGEHMRAEAMAA